MKKFIYFSLLLAIFFSCKKQEQPGTRPTASDTKYESNVKAYLKISMEDSDYQKTDFSNSILSKQGAVWFFRIAFQGKSIARDFILLQTDSLGHCTAGKFVHIRRDSSDMKKFNGKISTAEFTHIAVAKKVDNGMARTLECEEYEESIDEEDDCSLLVPECAGCLPEVVVVGYTISSSSGGGGGLSYSDYISLSNLINSGVPSNSTTAPSSGVYSPIASPTLPKPVKPSQDIVINYETNASKPGIDVAAFMKCFSAIPDAGATCSITILTDLPVDDNPSYIFNILTGATGHCFLQLTKTNGTQSVTQFIGKTTSKAIAVLGFPVPGKIVDNATHKYNASLTTNITPAQLQTAINVITAVGNTPQYDMWENNCVDYALKILNTVRSSPLQIVMLKDVTSGDSYSTPQGVYAALDKMKQANGPEAKNIVTDAINHAGTSHGACN